MKSSTWYSKRTVLGLVLSADLLGHSAVSATMPGPVTVFGASLGAVTGAEEMTG